MRFLTAVFLFAAGIVGVLANAKPATSNPPGAVVPSYGSKVEYTTGQAGVSFAADAKRMIELLESIDRRLEAIEAKPGAPAASTKAKGPDLLAVAKLHCVACHTPAKADKSGGGFILFADDGGAALKPLSGREKTSVKQAVGEGTMPPDGRKKLSAAEKAAFKW